MALRLRRGTDAERQLITPVQGELIYTTDTKLLYVGDGSTAGGTLVSGVQNLSNLLDVDVTGATDGQVLAYDTDLEKWVATDNVAGASVSSIFDLDDVFTDGSLAVGNILRWDGLNFTPAPITEIFQEQQNYKINIVGDDSTILVDTDTNTFTGNFIGDGSQLTNLPGGSGTSISSIFELNDVFTDGSLLGTGDILRWDGLNFTPAPINEIFQEQQNYKINIVGDDSTILVDTDTNTFTGVFVGDGSGLTNVAGASVSSIFDLDDVFTDGSLVQGNILRWDGLNFTPAPITEIFQEQQNYKINIVGDDSTILVDTDTNTFTGVFVGDVVGNVVGNVAGDVTGSVFGDNSTKIIDGLNNSIIANTINASNVTAASFIGDLTGSIFTDDSTLIVDGINSKVIGDFIDNNIVIPTNGLNLTHTDATEPYATVIMKSVVNKRQQLELGREAIGQVLAGTDVLSVLQSYKNDDNGVVRIFQTLTTSDATYITHDSTGVKLGNGSSFIALANNKFGFNNPTPTATVSVDGNVLATGSITPGVYADATARDTAITVPAEGMMIFNSALQKFQGYVSDTGLAGGGVSNATPGWIDIN